MGAVVVAAAFVQADSSAGAEEDPKELKLKN